MFGVAVAAAIIGIGLALVVGGLSEGGYTRFFFAYVINFAFFLSLALGALFFVMIQHLTRSGWSVTVRRVAEVLAATAPVLAVAFVPIVFAVVKGDAQVYPWGPQSKNQHHGAVGGHHQQGAEHEAQSHHAPGPDADEGGVHDTHGGVASATLSAGAHNGHNAHGDYSTPDEHGASAPPDAHAEEAAHHGENHLLAAKAPYLNTRFFVLRWMIYFGVWSFLALRFWRLSLRQDASGDPKLTLRMQRISAPGMWLFAITLTLASFDLLMSLSPAWYSTIFGVYYFTGGVVATFALMIVLLNILQGRGLLTQSVTTEHYHDLGKYLFAFVFFWGHIAFSQYMLIWYANLPETTFWFTARGVTTAAADANGWSVITIALLLGHFFIPFAGLLSRHIKRDRTGLVFWSVWLLVFHWIDLWWLVMPHLGPQVRFGIPEIATFLAVGGLFFAAAIRIAAAGRLLPARDPRLNESLAFENL